MAADSDTLARLENASIMKVVVFFQFYLPYLLPRTPDWVEAEHPLFFFNHNGHKVIVRPRGVNEALFPNELDQKLAKQTLTVPTPDIPLQDIPTAVAAKTLCYDRVEAQVFGEIASADNVHDDGIRTEYLLAAMQSCNQFLQHCSLVARDPDITGVKSYFNFDDRFYYFPGPYTMIWCLEENGIASERLRDSQGNLLEGASWSITSPERRGISIQDLFRSLSLGPRPNLALSFLIQAKDLIAVDRLQEGIIDLGSALEVASKQYIHSKGKDTDAEISKIGNNKKKSFAERRYHLMPIHIDS